MRVLFVEDDPQLSAFLLKALREIGAVVDHAPDGREGLFIVKVAVQGPAWVHGDRDLLFQALANLVDNAVKYTPPGGRIAAAA